MKSYLNRMILHIDGDAFFASIEQAKNWRLKGKPVITGGERFIAASMSYEAKALGVTRGMKVPEIRKVCPQAIIVSSDYVTYTIFARRMYDIVRRYAAIVEEYSIDECFADITGLDHKYGKTYEQIALEIKQELEKKLGITFGVGLSATKVLAKIASKHRKPAGFTYISGEESVREDFLKNLPIEKVWGIGSSTTQSLRNKGVMTALQFAQLSSYQLSAFAIAKPYREIHAELNGFSVMSVAATPREMPKSVMSSRTFVPASNDADIVFSHLSKNIEEACEHIRHVHAKACACTIYIKSQDFRYYNIECVFDAPTDDAATVIKVARNMFGQIFKHHLAYRATGISLRSLVPAHIAPSRGLFDQSSDQVDNCRYSSQHLGMSIDKINRKFGNHTIMYGSSMKAIQYFDAKRMARTANSKRRVWELPYLGTVKK